MDAAGVAANVMPWKWLEEKLEKNKKWVYLI